jgi:hypothetical protein
MVGYIGKYWRDTLQEWINAVTIGMDCFCRSGLLIEGQVWSYLALYFWSSLYPSAML